jgi:hypothetical protein
MSSSTIICGVNVSLGAHSSFMVVALGLCLVYRGMSKIGPKICIVAGCFSCASSGSESDTLEGVEIIEMSVLTDRGVAGGVGGGEYDGGGVGGRNDEEYITE